MKGAEITLSRREFFRVSTAAAGTALGGLAGLGGAGLGAVRAMAEDVLLEWRLAQQHAPFRRWLAQGAPSDDAEREPARAARSELPPTP